MDLIVVRDKYGIYIIQLIDQLHASIVAEKKTGSAQRVSRQRRVRQDGHAV